MVSAGSRAELGMEVRAPGAGDIIGAMSPELYRILHVVGVLFLFCGLGGIFATAGKEKKPAGLFLALHGIGLLAMLVAGIGFAHKSGLGWPNWVIAKIGCWLLLAVLPTLLRRGVLPRAMAVLLALAIGGAAVWLAQMKPF